MIKIETSHNPFLDKFQGETSDIPIAMQSFVALSSLFGYPLVDRSGIRKGQNPALASELGVFVPESQLPCPIRDRFFYGSVDLMMARPEGQSDPAFYVVEVNGSNAAGLTDVALADVARIADAIASSVGVASASTPSVIINSYTGEQNINVHERVVVADAIQARYPNLNFRLVPTTALDKPGFQLEPDALSIVIGPISKMLQHLSLENRQLHLKGVPVSVIINDLTVDRIAKALPDFHQCLDNTLVLNRIHQVTNLKARSYEAFKHRIVPALSPRFPIRAFDYWQADTREELEALSLRLALEEKRSVVLKPYSSSVGLGIEFLKPDMTQEEVLAGVNRSIEEAEGRYQGTSPLFPYTLCEFVETTLCSFPERDLFHRKFDLRFFVIRQEEGLYAIPGVIKLASEEYNAAAFHREGLQTNTMRLTQKSARPMAEIFESLIQPMNNPASLKALGLGKQDIRMLGEMACQVVGHLVKELDYNRQ